MTNDTLREVTALKTTWDENASRLFEKCRPTVGVEAVKKAVESGAMTLYEVRADGLLLGLLIFRVEELLDGTRELVVPFCASEAKASVAFTSLCAPIIERIARDGKFDSIRIHSERRGMDAVAEEHGCKFQESIFRKVLA